MASSECTPTKRCSKCAKEYPATNEYFAPRKNRKSPFDCWCRICRRERDRAISQTEEYRARKRRTSQARRQIPEIRERENEKLRKRWRENEAFRSRQLLKFSANRRDPQKQEALKEQNKIWRNSPSGKVAKMIGFQKRRTKQHALLNTFTSKDWRHAIEHFHGCCAVCGRQANDLFGTHTLAADHWIALSSLNCPGTVAWNIVPLCHGVNGCNNSKGNKEAITWLVEKFGNAKASRIEQRIQAYLSSAKD